jgi:phosphohistidine phosphatase
VQPDLILSSPAMRALTTAKIIPRNLDYKPEDIVVDDRLDDRLYAGEADDLFNVIHKLGDKLERVNSRIASQARSPTCQRAPSPSFTFVAKSWSNIGKDKPAKAALDYPKKS